MTPTEAEQAADMLAGFLRDLAEDTDEPVLLSINARAGLLLSADPRYWPLLREVGFNLTTAVHALLAGDDEPPRIVAVDLGVSTENDDSMNA